MPLNIKIPDDSDLAIVGGVFKAVLNNPTVGKWDFTNYKVGGTRFNYGVPLGLAFEPNYLYFFHQFNFSLTIDEATYLTALTPGAVPLLSVKDTSTQKNIFHAPLRVFRYFENSAIDSFHYSANKNAELTADFQCVLDQVADLVGITTIFAQVSMSVYQIKNQKFIKAYESQVG
jgi:hypothetical protein